MYWQYFDKISLTYGRQPINERRQIMWHPCDSPMCPNFLNEFSKFHHFEKLSFMNWQTYMRSIYWQAMPKVKKESDKQRQRLYKVRKRYEKATNKKEVQAKHALKNRAYRVDVHVPNNDLVFAATYVFVVWNFTRTITMLKSFKFFFYFFCGWKECGVGGGGA